MCIQQTKAEIAALRPSNSDDDRLIAVTNELDAIVTVVDAFHLRGQGNDRPRFFPLTALLIIS
jgi:hypothetical protein